MDQNRQIRFLIPPFILFISLLLGAHFDKCNKIFAWISTNTNKDSIGLIAIAITVSIASAFALGFIIGTIKIFVLRCISFVFGKKTYEAVFAEATQRRMWKQNRMNLKFNPELVLYTTATFDHELLDKGIHEWGVRRWNSFNVSSNCATALFFSPFIGALIFNINLSCWWLIFCITFFLLFVCDAFRSWKESMNMLTYQSFREQNKSITK